MKKLLTFITIIIIGFSFSDMITKKNIYDLFINEDFEIINNNSYYIKENTKDNYSSYLKYLDKDTIDNNDELYSMMYTILNNGYDKYTFTCNYNCLNDIDKIDSLKLSLINQLINPKNSYKEIKTTYSTCNKVDLTIIKKYSDEDIKRINTELDNIIKKLNINSYSNVNDRIKVFHDYIADKNTYDQDMADKGSSEYHSNTAIGALFEGKAICDGYSDAMAFFLDKIGVENIKVTNDEHVWNVVKINNTWYHIDITWDDPIYTNGSNLTTHEYFMITTNELEKKNDEEHYFDKTIYDFIK